jgi:hypothetical protein
MKESLEAITTWLQKSGLVVNKTKTEICALSKRAVAPVTKNRVR